jgi:hypothetical protein
MEPVKTFPCCKTSATTGAVAIEGPVPPAPLATARAVAVLKTAREVAPERACTIATRT